MKPIRKKALVFFQHNPFPPRTGAHQRCLAVIQALKQLECEVSLYSSTLHTGTTWHDADIPALEKEHGIHIEVFVPRKEDIRYAENIRWDDIRREQWGLFASPSLKKAFVAYARKFKPDAVIVNYTFFGDLVADPVFKNTLTIMESLDMFSLSAQMQKHLYACLPPPPIPPDHTPAFLLDDDMIRDFHLDIWPEEYAMCDLYDVSVMVSPAETKAVGDHTRSTRVVRIPITAEAVDLHNTYRGAPVYLAALNMLNVQGYLYFARRVLPLIQASTRDFSMDVIGSCCHHVEPIDGLVHRGYVDSLADIYRDCPFTICPLLGATGQQIKVVESMAHGVPVVVHQNVAESSPVIHGVNGLVAHNPEEFAAHCLRLHKDRDLCRRMGEAARETIRKAWSQATLTQGFADILKKGKLCRREEKRQTATRLSKRPTTPSKKPFLSVLVDARRNKSLLKGTLESIAQSTDPSVEVLVLDSSKKGADKRIKGRWMTILQAGDRIELHAAAELKQVATAHPDIAIFQGRPAFCDETGRLTWIMDEPPAGNQSTLLWSRRAGIFWRSSKWPRSQPDLTPDLYVSQLMQMLSRGALWAVVEALWGAAHPDGRSAKAGSWPEIDVQFFAIDPAASAQLARKIRAARRADGMELLHSLVADKEKTLETRVKQKALQIGLLEQLVRTRWQSLAGLNKRQARIALFGAGAHTQWLLSLVRNISGPTVEAILDDRAMPGLTIENIPVQKAETFDIATIDAIVLSTDCHEEPMTRRCRELFGPRIRILHLYDGLPAGPYLKI